MASTFGSVGGPQRRSGDPVIRHSGSVPLPIWYLNTRNLGRSIQIAVRLRMRSWPFVDGEVREHRAPSWVAVVLRALERERRRHVAARDAEILSRTVVEDDLDDPDGLDDLARHAAGLFSDLD